MRAPLAAVVGGLGFIASLADNGTPRVYAAPQEVTQPSRPDKNASQQPIVFVDNSPASLSDAANANAGESTGGATPEEGGGSERPIVEMVPKHVELILPAQENTLPAPAVAKVSRIQFDGVTLADAMKLFTAETGLNVICSAEAGETEITVYLRDVDPITALQAIVKANGLYYRLDQDSDIFRIATAEEYEKDLTSFREEQTRVFTLLYPNPVAVAQVIGQIYGQQVDLNMADADFDHLADLSQRFNRFDLVDGRALGLGTFDHNNSSLANANASSVASGGLGSGVPGLATSRTPLGLGAGRGSPARADRDTNLSAKEAYQIEQQLASGEVSKSERASLMHRGKATIYVSTIRRNNQIVVRTADTHSMAEIEQLVKQLDVPTPTVLLEVKVLRVSLADGVNSAFEYFTGGESAANTFSDGNLAPEFPGASAVGRSVANGLGLAGSIPGSLTFQVVDSNFRFRMQALESQSRVTALATPLIMTANNEVSRIFVGDTLPFTVGFTPSKVLGGPNAGTSGIAATPITELRDVGQSLLITPNINADRTVTLRVVEENSERVLGGATIPVPDIDGRGVTSVQVDTVRRRTVSGTIVAHDGMAVALGGLIEETVSDATDKVPVLGNIPGLGLLFRRQASVRSRSELIVVIRPYVFSTPSESAATCHSMLDTLSTHPNSPDVTGTMNSRLPCEVIHSDPECQSRASLFQFHNINTLH